MRAEPSIPVVQNTLQFCIDNADAEAEERWPLPEAGNPLGMKEG
jgi:hypothetical protein